MWEVLVSLKFLEKAEDRGGGTYNLPILSLVGHTLSLWRCTHTYISNKDLRKDEKLLYLCDQLH
jgi:hypothetical protein